MAEISQEIKMSNRRRRAHDFTDSLNSFRQTIIKDELSLISLDDSTKNTQDEYNKYTCSKNNISCDASVILAGSSTGQPCNIVKENYNTAYKNIRHPLLRDDTLIVSDETSYLSLKPDLNKCINLFNNEYLNEYDSAKEQLSSTLSEANVSTDIIFRNLNKNKSMGQSLNNRPRSMSTESLRNIILNRELRRSKSYTVLDKALKRDRNYNIKRDQFSFPVKNTVKTNYNAEIETIFPPLETLSLSKLSAVSNRKDDSTKEHDSVNIEMSSKDELNPSELKTFLQSLVDPEPLVESSAQQRLLRRLSTHYYDSPKVFTEGLLTIIEESVINNDSCAQSQYPEFSLFRFNEELRKMCKFLEDETAPEWPGSPGMSTSFCAKRKSQGLNDLLRKSLGVLSPDKDLHFTMPVSSPCNIKSPKKAYRRISKNISYNTKNVFNDSTNTFESLEAMCKNLYPDQDCTVPAKEKNLLQSPLQNMVKILRTCENQMASLENSPNIHERVKKAGTCTSDSAYQRNKLLEEQNLEHRLLLNEKYDRTDSERVPDILWQTEHGKCQEMIEQNDFENTVMYEIAKKRQKCLDTVKVVMEIDETFKPLEQIHLNINDSSSIEDDKFMQTLISVKQYQDYLEKYKSLLGLFHRTKLNTCTPCDRQAVQDKKIDKQSKVKAVQGKKLSVVLNDKQILKIPSPRKKSISPSTKCSTNVVSKPRLFITPGKTPFNRNCKLKRTYFPNLLPENKQNKHVSSQAKSIYRQMGNYDHVVSPVGAYIKGTESRLTKNDQPKRILTQSPNSKVKLQSSSKPKKKLTGTTVGDENVANNFLHPKMHYNYPSSSHIEKTENLNVENYEI